MRSWSWWMAALAGALCCVGSARGADTVIVYDASNSMWGQIDGEAKITIARRVMTDLVRDWDQGTNVGLVAYGHRRAGDCTDIETVVPVGSVDREALIAKVNALRPTGKTPLTDAVRHAAGELKYRDNPATVVLISDGIESCNADPCAVSEELARAGIRFTAHVVGFDVPDDADQEQLRCIAENTGGRFFAARGAQDLQAALSQVSEMAAEPEPPEAEVALTAPATAVAGSEVKIAWSGEDIHPRDLVTVVPADAAPDARGKYERVQEKSSATLTAPGEVGAYEARYVSSASGRAVAASPMELTEPRVAVSAPESVTGGADFTVRWENPVHARDWVTVVPAGTPPDEYGSYIRVKDDGSGTLTAPGDPGAYEVRYHLHASGQSIASAALEVTGQQVSVSAPQEVTIGSDFTVQWQGAVHPRDYVTIVAADAPDGEYGTYARVKDRGRASLTAPGDPGAYEVRYMLQEDKSVLARTPVEVVGAEVSVSAPQEVTIGSDFTVQWQGAVHPRDYVTIVAADAPDGEYGTYARVKDRTETTLTAPGDSGAYEVRYMLQEDKSVLGRTPVAVTGAEISLEAPDKVAPGSKFTVQWDRAIHPRDYVAVAAADAPDEDYDNYTRVGDGTQGSLEAPEQPGSYEVRYILNEGRKALGRIPLSVEE